MARYAGDLCWRCGVRLAGQRAYRVRLLRRGRRARRAWVCRECGYVVAMSGPLRVVVEGVEVRYALA